MFDPLLVVTLTAAVEVVGVSDAPATELDRSLLVKLEETLAALLDGEDGLDVVDDSSPVCRLITKISKIQTLTQYMM